MVRLRLVTAAAAVLAAAGVLAGPGLSKPGAVRPTTKLTVVMSEYKFVLSKKSVPYGTVLVTLVNKGTIDHNMVFNGPFVYLRTPLITPGETYHFKLVLKKPGSYPFVCAPHFELGMVGALRATK
jgi:plastocyanin